MSSSLPISLSVTAALLLGLCLPVHAGHPQSHAATDSTTTLNAAEVQDALRDLWIGHVFWVRSVVTETLAGNKAAAKIAEAEVVSNARSIASSIEPFYGKAASDKLFELLAAHYGAIKQYLNASVAGNQTNLQSAQSALTKNAGEIAVFLSSANPNLPELKVRNLLIAHGAHHIQQITQLRGHQYAQEARTWSDMTKHMYVISDAIVGAIGKQFPDRFK